MVKTIYFCICRLLVFKCGSPFYCDVFVFLQLNGGTYPGTVQKMYGGVGRNVADCLSRLGVSPLFVSGIGNDSHKTAFQAYCSHMVIYTNILKLKLFNRMALSHKKMRKYNFQSLSFRGKPLFQTKFPY